MWLRRVLNGGICESRWLGVLRVADHEMLLHVACCVSVILRSYLSFVWFGCCASGDVASCRGISKCDFYPWFFRTNCLNDTTSKFIATSRGLSTTPAHQHT